jgi:hypothetical protein
MVSAPLPYHKTKIDTFETHEHCTSEFAGLNSIQDLSCIMSKAASQHKHHGIAIIAAINATNAIGTIEPANKYVSSYCVFNSFAAISVIASIATTLALSITIDSLYVSLSSLQRFNHCKDCIRCKSYNYRDNNFDS